jgi:predicted oxidoreductase
MHHLRLISLAAVIGAALPVAVWAKPGNLTSKAHAKAAPRFPACWPVTSSHVDAPGTRLHERRCTAWSCFT